MEREERNEKLQEKFDKIEQQKKNIDSSHLEFMSTKREQNLFKIRDHRKVLNRIQRGQSAKKSALMEKLMEKGNRGREISERKNRISEMAIINQQNIRS